MGPSPLRLDDGSLLKDKSYINGKWVDAKSGKTFDVDNPASGEVIGTLPDMDSEDTEIAIEAAAEALKTFSKTRARDRGRMLYKWYQLMLENKEDLAKLITLENGKPLLDARNEVVYAAEFLEWFSGEALRLGGETVSAGGPGHRIYTMKQPIGVCGLITPWNWPAGMVTRKVGPAIAAGCTVVLKSPGETPLTSAALAVLGERAGIPPGVFNIVSTLHNTPNVGSTLTSSPTVKKISFTGSTRVGKILMKQSSDTLKKLSLELGGNAPCIIFDDADFDQAVESAVAVKFRSSGQICIAANRIYVQKGIYDKFAAAFTRKVEAFKMGSGYKDGITHGPLIHDRAVAKAKEHTDDALEKGGKLLTGGKTIPDLGPNFFQLTVIGNMKPDMKLAHEETFGPVAGLFPFETEAEVIKHANDTEVGLAGYFYSNDVKRCYRIAEAMEVGMVGINTDLLSDTAMPFGGVKESGFGREGSIHGINEYIVYKSVNHGGIEHKLQGS